MKVNVYDFDGTIYDGDSARDFVKYSYKNRYITLKEYVHVYYTYFKYLVGVYDKTEFKENIYRFLNKIDDIDSVVNDFWKIHRRKLKDFYLVKNHRKDIINSASPYFLLEGICSELRVKGLIASNVDKKTGKYLGNNNGGYEKVKNLYDKYPDAIVNEVYSDSIDDKPILDLAKNAYMVKGKTIYDYKDYKPSLRRKIWDLYRKYLEVINYLVVGGLTTFISILVYGLCSRLFNLKLISSNIISWIVAVLFAYYTNKIFVFKSKGKSFKEFVSFVGSRVITLLLDTALMLLFVNVINMNDLISKVIVQIVVIIGNYIISKLIVFKKRVK